MKFFSSFLFLCFLFYNQQLYSDILSIKAYDPLESITSQESKLSIEKLTNKEWILKKIKELNKFIITNPENHQAYVIRGLFIYFLTTLERNKTKQYEYLLLGQGYSKEALKKFPHSSFLQMTYISFTAQIYLLMGIPHVLKNAEKIAKAMQTLIKNNPGCCYGRAAFFLGRLYFKLPGFPISHGSLEKSKKYLRLAIKYNPALLAAYISLADTEYAMGNSENALRILQKAAHLKPTRWLDYYNYIYFYPAIEIMRKKIKNNSWSRKDDIFLIIKTMKIH